MGLVSVRRVLEGLLLHCTVYVKTVPPVSPVHSTYGAVEEAGLTMLGVIVLVEVGVGVPLARITVTPHPEPVT